jgi:hypothetical protein
VSASGERGRGRRGAASRPHPPREMR